MKCPSLLSQSWFSLARCPGAIKVKKKKGFSLHISCWEVEQYQWIKDGFDQNLILSFKGDHVCTYIENDETLQKNCISSCNMNFFILMIFPYVQILSN